MIKAILISISNLQKVGNSLSINDQILFGKLNLFNGYNNLDIDKLNQRQTTVEHHRESVGGGGGIGANYHLYHTLYFKPEGLDLPKSKYVT